MNQLQNDKDKDDLSVYRIEQLLQFATTRDQCNDQIAVLCKQNRETEAKMKEIGEWLRPIFWPKETIKSLPIIAKILDLSEQYLKKKGEKLNYIVRQTRLSHDEVQRDVQKLVERGLVSINREGYMTLSPLMKQFYRSCRFILNLA